MLYIFLCLRYKNEKKKKFTLKIYFIDNLKKYEFRVLHGSLKITRTRK